MITSDTHFFIGFSLGTLLRTMVWPATYRPGARVNIRCASWPRWVLNALYSSCLSLKFSRQKLAHYPLFGIHSLTLSLPREKFFSGPIIRASITWLRLGGQSEITGFVLLFPRWKVKREVSIETNAHLKVSGTML